MAKLIFKVTFLVIIFSTIHSCKKETKEIEEEFKEQIYSELSIENQDYDFGLISVNDTVLYTYHIKNISEEPLKITRIISNCDCIEINFNKQSLQKNQILDISTKFIATKDKIGSVNNLMLIECNIEKGVAVLSMSGYISEIKK